MKPTLLLLTAVIILASVVAQDRATPSDVPRDHWAFPAVDRMFREGLLKGYPPQAQQAADAAHATVAILHPSTPPAL